MTELKLEPFFIVWQFKPGGENIPVIRHQSQESACLEAERLARRHPGGQFVVLQSVCCKQVQSMLTTDLRPKEVLF